MYCLETKNVTYRFSNKEIVLNNINLKVISGSIYGFLGPNGAGKTTTLKLILGLLNRQQGEVFIFGKSINQNRIEVLKNVGSLIENPSLYGHLTATENLTLLQKIYQCPKERIKEVLDAVGLLYTSNKKTSRFSLGMKQRLSIAVALLHNPALLILDEPTNGLDPNGMLEIRELLARLNHEHGITIVISSHLLAEIEKLVTYVGVINKGSMLFQGTLNELKSRQNETLVTVFDTNDNDKAIQIISENKVIASIKDRKVLVPALSKKEVAMLTAQLIKNNLEVYEVSAIKNDLETIFMNLINN